MGGGFGNGGKSDLFGNTSAAVDFYKFRWDPMNTETLLFVYYQEKLVEEVAIFGFFWTFLHSRGGRGGA